MKPRTDVQSSGDEIMVVIVAPSGTNASAAVTSSPGISQPKITNDSAWTEKLSEVVCTPAQLKVKRSESNASCLITIG